MGIEQSLAELQQPNAIVTSTYSLVGKRQTVQNWSSGGPYSASLDWQGDYLRDMGVTGALFTFYPMPGEWGPAMERTLAGTGYLLPDLMHNTRQEVFGSTVLRSFAYT